MAAWFGACLLLNWLTPVDFDGAAHVSLKESDARLKLEALLTWELKNLLELLDVISRQLLLPLQGLLAQSEARDKLARLTQYTLLMVNGLVVALGGPSSAAARLRAVMRPLADARQTGRWLKGVAPLLALRGELAACASAPRFGSAPAIAAKLALLGYFLLDHVAWLHVETSRPEASAKSPPSTPRAAFSFGRCVLAARGPDRPCFPHTRSGCRRRACWAARRAAPRDARCACWRPCTRAASSRWGCAWRARTSRRCARSSQRSCVERRGRAAARSCAWRCASCCGSSCCSCRRRTTRTSLGHTTA